LRRVKVLVTGANGSLGLAVARMLVRAGHFVVAFVHNVDEFRRFCREERVGIYEGDILDRSSVVAVDRCDAVVHCAHFPPRNYKLNWDAVRHALEAMRPGGYFVYPGDARIYERPQHGRVTPDHPRTKGRREDEIRIDLERAALAEGGTIVHLAEIYGPGVRGGRLPRAFRRAVAGKRIWFSGDLDAAVEFLYVDDAARALVAPLGRPISRGRIYAAPGPRPIAPRSFIDLIHRSLGRAPTVCTLPRPLDRLLRRMYPEPRFPAEFVYAGRPQPLLDGSRIRRELGWMPEVPYGEGVQRTIRWLREADR
jgi:nucleoside-diphosphate-sugar epimerase